MASPSLGDTYTTLHSDTTVATSGSSLMSGPASVSVWCLRHGMELRELEAVSPLSTLSQVTETQLNTQAIMHELFVHSEVTIRKVLGSADLAN